MPQENGNPQIVNQNKKNPYDFSSVFIAMAVAMILWYGVNLLAERLNISFEVSDSFVGILLFLCLVAFLVTIFLVVPVYISRELILRWTGKKLRLLRIFFVLLFSILFTTIIFGLFSALFDLGSLEITSRENGGGLEVVLMIFYYTLTALLASLWLWKRPETGSSKEQ